MAEPTTSSALLDAFLAGENATAQWAPNVTIDKLQEINGHTYVVTLKAGENRGSWSFVTAKPYGAQASATITVTDPETGAATQVTASPDQLAADTAALKYLIAKREYESGLDPAKAEVDLDAAVEALNQARTKGAYLDRQIVLGLEKDAADIAGRRASTAQTQAQTDIAVAKAPGEIAETGARTGLLRTQTSKAEIENAIAVLGPLATLEEREAALEEMVRRRVISPETAAQIGARFDEEIATGIPALERFKEEQATTRSTATNQAAMDRQRAQDEAAGQRSTQTQQTTAATSITGDEAARQRQILQSTVQQQANQAQATNAFMNNYQNTGSPSPTATGAGFLDGLAMVRDIFGSIKDIAQPAAQLPQAQDFLGNLLANQGGGVPPAPGAVPPPGVAAPPPQEPEYFDDPLMAAAASEDDTPLPDEDLAQIMPLMQTNPQQAANLSVAAWQRMVSGNRSPSRVGAR